MEQKRNSICYRLSGKYALFTDPVTKLGGEKCSYHVPTYEALKGITEAIYWKPTIRWVIDAVRLIKPVQTQSKGIRPIRCDSDKNDLATYTYLKEVEYRVLAHFEQNLCRPDLNADFNENKHHNIAKRYLEKGGKRDVFLGARECVGYVEPCAFDAGSGAYDAVDELDFGVMFHSFLYPSETGKNELVSNLSRIVMKHGVIEFERPELCAMSRVVKPMEYTLKPSTVTPDGETVFFSRGSVQ